MDFSLQRRSLKGKHLSYRYVSKSQVNWLIMEANYAGKMQNIISSSCLLSTSTNEYQCHSLEVWQVHLDPCRFWQFSLFGLSRQFSPFPLSWQFSLDQLICQDQTTVWNELSRYQQYLQTAVNWCHITSLAFIFLFLFSFFFFEAAVFNPLEWWKKTKL